MKPQECPIYVDVDDTMIRSFGTKRIPITSVVQHVQDLHAQGFPLYCWSRVGAEYARSSAEELGIAHCFQHFLPKPSYLIDDMSLDRWTFLKEIHPNACSSRTPADYLE